MKVNKPSEAIIGKKNNNDGMYKLLEHFHLYEDPSELERGKLLIHDLLEIFCNKRRNYLFDEDLC